MKHSIIMPTYVYDGTRAQLATQAMHALAGTRTYLGSNTVLWVLIKPTVVPGFNYPDAQQLADCFNELQWTEQPGEITGTEQTLAYGTHYLFEQGADYVTWMGDDADFNPNWLLHLQTLIKAKPDAKSWSVYRSAHEAFHKTIEEEDDVEEMCGVREGYVKVSSICGHGLTLSKEEWQAWGIDWRTGSWPSPYGDTLDLRHIYDRPGDRWVTKKSYIEHTGKDGVHCNPSIPEYAIDFQK